MISGKSLDEIARALKMSVDHEGRPAFTPDSIDFMLRRIVEASTPLGQGRILAIDLMFKPSPLRAWLKEDKW